ncbi:hypothetical protein Afil01_15080 [Actinorhabdospora filicis]|uniref:Potassium channel domain-containing protein n=1 Tax=Actinorhabdospora filicis TaxID=1785913 RepID=A0A9W6W8P7_9ACTN|nr:ion channel [Actinorhabdospora filicis]GLZ76701.1 hypothetical protein Afil01_15080 [Actinorhabdospora filicis]
MRLRTCVVLAAMLAAYYLLPSHPSDALPLLRGIGSVLILAGLAVLFVRQIKAQARASEDTTVRLESLFYLVSLTVFVFAFTYYALARSQPGQFAGLSTRTDALYFTVTTMATVGFGDVHAAGQVARGLVTVNMIFNVVFVGVFASVLAARVRRAVERRRSARG